MQYKMYKRRIIKKNLKEFIIFNTPIHGNIGDQAIIYAEEQLLKKMNIEPFEIPTYREKYFFEYIKKNAPKDAIISITGGGFIGSQWIEEQNLVNKVLKNFEEHKIIIFPCTIYFKDDEQGKDELLKFKESINNVDDISIFAREEKTYKIITDEIKNARGYLMPDIVLSLDKIEIPKEREEILICLRRDEEAIFTSENKDMILDIIGNMGINIRYTDTVIDMKIEKTDRERILKNKLEEFSKAKLIITDRLHGMIFAYLTNTPCIVFSNYNYKVQGVYNWIKDKTNNIIYETDVNNIRKDIEKLYNNLENRTSNNTELDFKELKELIKNL